MRQDDPYQHLSLINEQGDTVQNVWYPASPALWSSDRKRLTVLLDPGRIKRGLAANNQWGLALTPGKTYHLVISKEFSDQWGNPLGNDFKHRFSITNADYKSPVLDRWSIISPIANTNEPLILKFDEPMDQAQCLRWIEVSFEGKSVAGRLELGANEIEVAFIPDAAWVAGNYLVRVFNKLEDRSGNSVRKPFEITNKTNSVEEAGWQNLDLIINQRTRP